MDAANTTELPNVPSIEYNWNWQSICGIILSLIGIVGNSLVIAVYHGSKKQNNFTNVLILALACADLISSVCFIPLPVFKDVPQNAWGDIYCRVVYTQSLLWISIEASVYTLTVLSVERYLAVVHPLRYRSVFTKPWPKRFVWLIWIFAVLVKSFIFYQTIIVEGRGCVVISFPEGFNLLIAIGVAIIEYFIPIGVMIICNGFIIRALRAQARKLQGHRAAGSSNSTSENGPALSVLKIRRRVIHVVLIVIITFIICWTPNQISFLVVNLGILPSDHLGSDLHRAFVILAFFNSCANPIIYTFKNKQFRTSVVNMFRPRSGRVADSTLVTDKSPTALAREAPPINTISKRTTMTSVEPLGKTTVTSESVHSVNSAEEAS